MSQGIIFFIHDPLDKITFSVCPKLECGEGLCRVRVDAEERVEIQRANVTHFRLTVAPELS